MCGYLSVLAMVISMHTVYTRGVAPALRRCAAVRGAGISARSWRRRFQAAVAGARLGCASGCVDTLCYRQLTGLPYHRLRRHTGVRWRSRHELAGDGVRSGSAAVEASRLIRVRFFVAAGMCQSRNAVGVWKDSPGRTRCTMSSDRRRKALM